MLAAVFCMLLLQLVAVHASYAGNWVLNDPYPNNEIAQNIYYSSYVEQPKTLDPAKSYNLNEDIIIAQIYEPPLQFDYFKRPYTLIPATASKLPEVHFYDAHNQETKDPQAIVKSVYVIHITPGIFYQPHPAFAKDAHGNFIYIPLAKHFLLEHAIYQIADFKQLGTRELKADDYIYQIKRLAAPFVNSPIYGLMSRYIVGFKEYGQSLPSQLGQGIDLRQYPLSGVQKIDEYTYSITIKGHYQQFIYWLALHFFAPTPWEADQFYQQKGMQQRNLSFSSFPVGTGPFMLTYNNPNSRMILAKNPQYRAEYFPTQATEHDIRMGYMHHRGQRLPLLDKAVYTLEKESIPRWSKFLQGYYDASAISADSFDEAIQINQHGELSLGHALQQKNIRLARSYEPAIFYMGFNMLDPVVGGSSERARQLRQAIAIAVNFDEYISIFLNGRGIPAQSPIPPGIFGHRNGAEGVNPSVYIWQHEHSKRRTLAEARALMRAAGYANGKDPQTGQALMLHYDVATTAGPDDKAQLDWMRKQFAKIGIALNVRATHYNRFQEKMRTGNSQIFSWGWSADYPDPENFLFLLYGANGMAKYGGENVANYCNASFDHLFDLMKIRSNDAERQRLIDDMITILRHDTPWLFGYYPETFVLSQSWVAPIKANAIATNSLKYVAIDVQLRQHLRQQWNRPIWWPLWLLLGLMLCLLLPIIYYFRQKNRRLAPRGRIC